MARYTKDVLLLNSVDYEDLVVIAEPVDTRVSENYIANI